MIYALDFLSAGIYFLLFLLLRGGWFNYPGLLAVSFLTGIIDGTYIVAFDSFYPNLITEGNFQKAYSISGMLVDLADLASPLAAVIYYGTGGAAALFAFNAVSFLAAACFVPFVGGALWKGGTTKGAVASSVVGMATVVAPFPGQVVLGAIRKQSEQARGSNPVSSTPP